MSEHAELSTRGETANLAKYIAGLKYEDLPREVIAKIKQHILDTLGAIVAGVQLDSGRLIMEFARQQGGKAESTVIGSDFKSSCVTACLANGTAGHADEVDDLHHPSIQHPGCSSVPAALAVGERIKADGKAFLTAVVLGYEIDGRVGRALDVRVLRKHNHSGMGIAPCFASAAVASHLLGLGEDQICSAFGLAAEQASGTYAWLTEPTHMAKAFDIGAAGRNGATAALLAQQGFRGPAAVFDEPYSIFAAFSGGKSNLSELSKDLGTHYDVLGATIKKYPVGGPIQAPLEGLFQIMQAHGLRGEDIGEIIVGACKESVWLVGNRPIQDICMEHMIAAGAYFGKLGWEEAHSEEKLRDPHIQEFVKKVRYVADPALEDSFPRIRAASVQVSTRDGQSYRVVIEHVPGTPGNPFTQEQVEEKFLRLSSPVLGTDKPRKIVRAVAHLDELKDVRRLGNLLRV